MDEINHTQVDLSGEEEDFQEWFQIQIQKALSINSVKCKSVLFLSFEQPIANETNIRIHNIITSHKAFDTSFHANNSSQEKIIQFLRENIYSLFQNTFDYESIEKMNEKVINKKYIDENVTADDVWSGLLPSIAESTKWLTHFAQQLPGFDKFDLEDFSFLVHGGVLPLHTLKYNTFYRNNENYTILKNNVIYNKKNVNLLFGKNLSDLVFLFFKKARSLNLTEREFALFHPFILLSCDSKFFCVFMICNFAFILL